MDKILLSISLFCLSVAIILTLVYVNRMVNYLQNMYFNLLTYLIEDLEEENEGKSIREQDKSLSE